MKKMVSNIRARSLAAMRPELAVQWDAERNDGMNPWIVGPGCNKRAHWICEKGHHWQARISSRAEGYGCKTCARDRRATAAPGRSLADISPHLVAEWDEEMNVGMTPWTVAPRSGMMAHWKCAKEHCWQRIIADRRKDKGCPYCSGYWPTPETCFGAVHKELLTEWDFDQNTVSPYELAQSSKVKVHWKCLLGHKWPATIGNRVHGRSGCPYCAGNLPTPETCLATVRPDLAAEWDYAENKHKPHEVTSKSGRRAYWRCSQGHEWEATIGNRWMGGCPVCANSKGETAVKKVLDRLEVTYREEFGLRRGKSERQSLRFDFAIAVKTTRALIEYQGIQHYEAVPFFGGQRGLKHRQERDSIKRDICRRLGLPLLEIPYTDFGRIAEVVTDFVRTLNQSA